MNFHECMKLFYPETKIILYNQKNEVVLEGQVKDIRKECEKYHNVEVTFVSLDFLTLQWFCNTLQTQHPQTQAAKELYDALEALYAGKSDSLMLELGEAIPEAASTSLVCGNLLIDSKSRRVIRDGAEIQLTPKEFDILYFLARNRGEVFTKEQIYQAVWAEEYYTADSNIMAFIRKLRKKIEPNPDAPEYILTIWGIGYKFNDKLRQSEI